MCLPVPLEVEISVVGLWTTKQNTTRFAVGVSIRGQFEYQPLIILHGVVCDIFQRNRKSFNSLQHAVHLIYFYCSQNQNSKHGTRVLWGCAIQPTLV